MSSTKALKYQKTLEWNAANPEKVKLNAKRTYYENHAYRQNKRLQSAYKRWTNGVAVSDHLVAELHKAGFTDVTWKQSWVDASREAAK
jgi:hypothetical protein